MKWGKNSKNWRLKENWDELVFRGEKAYGSREMLHNQKFTDFINYDKVETYKDFGGIRNEEDYLITETGARRLGKKIPLTPEEVEALR